MIDRSSFGCCLLLVSVLAASADEPVPSADSSSWETLFDGRSLQGWRGRPHLDPREEAGWEESQRSLKQSEWNQDRDQHWSVDREHGEIVSDGHGVFLTTEKSYGDFELQVDWKMVARHGDSGIYLRGSPQVQIWDPGNQEAFQHGADQGSGALWNNNPDNPGRWPLIKADRPIGEWNHFRIRMVGARVWVWFNEQLVVDAAIMNNYFDRRIPMFASGCIQLQTHGSEMRFRNVRIREIGAKEANQILAEHSSDGFQPIFNGENFDGWAGPIAENSVVDGCIASQHGTIYAKREWEDFSVQFEFKLPPGGNNGLAIRYPGSGDTAYVGMCELQVLDNRHEEYANLDARQYHGSAYGMFPAHRGYLRPAGQWNFQRVTVDGSHVRVELNGTIILDQDVSLVEDLMSGTPHPGKDRNRGYFGFAGHGDRVLFRNVLAKEL